KRRLRRGFESLPPAGRPVPAHARVAHALVRMGSPAVPAGGRVARRALATAGRDTVRVEHGVDVAQPADRAVEYLRVPDLHGEAVLDHLVADRAARLEDVDSGFGERAREVLEQPVAVPSVDVDLDLERGLALAVP